jgi:hypothetical protein
MINCLGITVAKGLQSCPLAPHCEPKREGVVSEVIGKLVMSLGTTKNGRPKHPLYMRPAYVVDTVCQAGTVLAAACMTYRTLPLSGRPGVYGGRTE